MENESTSVACERALEVYDANVSSLEVAKTYLKAEMPNVLSADSSQKNKLIKESLDNLSEKQIWRLLEAISYTYRMNGVFHETTNTAKQWVDVEMPIEAITLTSTKPHINDIVYSLAINRQPFEFSEYLRNYFANHHNEADDPEKLNEFRPSSDIKSLKDAKLIMRENGSLIEMVDGTHRLIAATLLGAHSVRTLVSLPNGQTSKKMIGDSSFNTLRDLYESTDSSKKRKKIIEVTAMLGKNSTDGVEAIQNYWIDHPRSILMKMAGKKVLEIINNKQELGIFDAIQQITPSQERLKKYFRRFIG